MVFLLSQAKGRLEAQHRRHSSRDAGIQSHGFTLTALRATHVHHTAPLFCPEPALLSDAQLDEYAERFQRLNTKYFLTTQHHFIFEDFLDSPDVFEREIHRYFANKSLFENRREGGKIHLHSFLRYPDLIEVALNIEEAYREAEAVKCEHLLPKQLAAVQKINLAEISWFQELVALAFEHHHRVLWRGTALVEPNTHYFRCERKQAGKYGR